MSALQVKWLVLGVIAIMAVKNTATRGIRNNNPGNIRKSSAFTWQGEIGQDDKGFVIFDSIENGLRALARTLRTYKHSHGLDSIDGIINRWAPTNENNTESYIKSVVNWVDIPASEPLALGDYPQLMSAIIYHENGSMPYDESQIEQGFLAGWA